MEPPEAVVRRVVVLDTKLQLSARELRLRAEEILTRAGTFNDPEARRTMEEIAAGYEELARRFETKLAGTSEA